MVWQKIIEINKGEDEAKVESRAGKQYSVKIEDSINLDDAKKALETKTEVWGDVQFNVQQPYGAKKIALLFRVKVGTWN